MKAVRTSWTGPEHAPIAREAPATTARSRRSRARSQDVYEELFELAPDAYLFTAPDGRIPCSMIVHELVSNALQHAFPGGGGGRIAIDLVEQIAGTLEVRRTPGAAFRIVFPLGGENT